MFFDVPFFQAIDKSNLTPSSILYVIAEVFIVTVLTIVFGIALNVIPPWWAAFRIPHIRCEPKTIKKNSRVTHASKESDHMHKCNGQTKDMIADHDSTPSKVQEKQEELHKGALHKRKKFASNSTESNVSGSTPDVRKMVKACSTHQNGGGGGELLNQGKPKDSPNGERIKDVDEPMRQDSTKRCALDNPAEDNRTLDDALDEFFDDEELLSDVLLKAIINDSMDVGENI